MGVGANYSQSQNQSRHQSQSQSESGSSRQLAPWQQQAIESLFGLAQGVYDDNQGLTPGQQSAIDNITGQAPPPTLGQPARDAIGNYLDSGQQGLQGLEGRAQGFDPHLRPGATAAEYQTHPTLSLIHISEPTRPY